MLHIFVCSHTYIYNFILYLRRFLSIVLSFPFAEKGHFYHVIRVWLFSTVFFYFILLFHYHWLFYFVGKKERRHTLKYCWWIFRFTTYNRLFGWKNKFFLFVRYLDQFLTICCHSQGGWKKGIYVEGQFVH